MPNLTPYWTALLVVAVVLLWSYFAFVLGPTLWRTQRRAFVLDLVVAGSGYGWVLVRFLDSGWLGEPRNATTVEALVAIAQAAFTVSLIVLTFRTVQANATMAAETKRMAEETEKMADETKKMARVAVEEQQSATRPILAFQLHPPDDKQGEAYADKFWVEIINIGSGPALDVWIKIWRGPLRFHAGRYPIQPLAIGAKERVVVEFSLSMSTPFVDPSHDLRWGGRAAEALLTRFIDRVRPIHHSSMALHGKYYRAVEIEKKLRVNFQDRVQVAASRLPTAGVLFVQYRDLNDNTHSSFSNLMMSPRHNSQGKQVWPALSLGPLGLGMVLRATATMTVSPVITTP